MRKLIVILLISIFALLTACSSSKSAGNYKVYDRKAYACYYADEFNGRKTANGERFSNKKLTAAHKKLPFGTKVKVTNPENNKSVIVTINDRGPFSGGFDIDLTKAAYQKIAGKSKGKLQVILEVQK